jgi:DNA polymerase V
MSSNGPVPTKWPKRYALVDCNSFYCSCERLFRPELLLRPVVVLSNNDGCIISLSAEAKAVGIKMGAPLHLMKDLIRRHKAAVFSSNYPLYGDLSRRVMSTLDGYTPELDVYSIDEAFMDFSHVPPGEEENYARQVRARVWRDVGIPVSIGIGATKVIAKAASRAAKKQLRPAVMLAGKSLEDTFQRLDVGDLWGIGKKSAEKLKAYGMHTAWDLRQQDNTALVRSLLTVTGERIRDELRGIDCIRLTDMAEKQMIASTRSFGQRVYERRELEEAVATYTGFACEKLRAQNCVAGGITVTIRSNPFDQKAIPYQNSAQTHLARVTCDTGDFTAAAIQLVRAIFRPGIAYKKAGIFLWDITPASQTQLDLFGSQNPRTNRLMGTIDAINQRWGRGTVQMAACGTTKDWRMLCEYRSKKTQLAWNDLVEVRVERSG